MGSGTAMPEEGVPHVATSPGILPFRAVGDDEVLPCPIVDFVEEPPSPRLL